MEFKLMLLTGEKRVATVSEALSAYSPHAPLWVGLERLKMLQASGRITARTAAVVVLIEKLPGFVPLRTFNEVDGPLAKYATTLEVLRDTVLIVVALHEREARSAEDVQQQLREQLSGWACAVVKGDKLDVAKQLRATNLGVQLPSWPKYLVYTDSAKQAASKRCRTGLRLYCMNSTSTAAEGASLALNACAVSPSDKVVWIAQDSQSKRFALAQPLGTASRTCTVDTREPRLCCRFLVKAESSYCVSIRLENAADLSPVMDCGAFGRAYYRVQAGLAVAVEQSHLGDASACFAVTVRPTNTDPCCLRLRFETHPPECTEFPHSELVVMYSVPNQSALGDPSAVDAAPRGAVSRSCVIPF